MRLPLELVPVDQDAHARAQGHHRTDGFGLDGESADVEAALRAGCGPCCEVGLHGDVGHFELHVVVEGRDVADHARTHIEGREQGLLDIEGHPHVAGVEDGHHGVAAADELALLGDDRRNLARHRGVDHCVVDIGFDLVHCALGLENLGRSGLLILLAGAVAGHGILSLCGLGRRLHRLVVGGGLVELLGRNDALVVEVFDALVGLAGQFEPGLRLLPHVACGLDLLDAGTGNGGLVQSRSGASDGLGLLELGVEFGRGERVKELAFLDPVALRHLHAVDAARHFRRSLVGRALHRALDQQRRVFGEITADERRRHDDQYGCGDDCNDVFAFHMVVPFTFCRNGSGERRPGVRRRRIRR